MVKATVATSGLIFFFTTNATNAIAAAINKKVLNKSIPASCFLSLLMAVIISFASLSPCATSCCPFCPLLKFSTNPFLISASPLPV